MKKLLLNILLFSLFYVPFCIVNIIVYMIRKMKYANNYEILKDLNFKQFSKARGNRVFSGFRCTFNPDQLKERFFSLGKKLSLSVEDIAYKYIETELNDKNIISNSDYFIDPVLKAKEKEAWSLEDVPVKKTLILIHYQDTGKNLSLFKMLFPLSIDGSSCCNFLRELIYTYHNRETKANTFLNNELELNTNIINKINQVSFINVVCLVFKNTFFNFINMSNTLADKMHRSTWANVHLQKNEKYYCVQLDETSTDSIKTNSKKAESNFYAYILAEYANFIKSKKGMFFDSIVYQVSTAFNYSIYNNKKYLIGDFLLGLRINVGKEKSKQAIINSYKKMQSIVVNSEKEIINSIMSKICYAFSSGITYQVHPLSAFEQNVPNSIAGNNYTQKEFKIVDVFSYHWVPLSEWGLNLVTIDNKTFITITNRNSHISKQDFTELNNEFIKQFVC